MVAWVGCWMWRQTLACGVLYLLSAEYSVVMCRAWPGTLVTWPWLRLSMIFCCAETLVSDTHHVLEVLVPSFGHPVLCQGKMMSVPLSCLWVIWMAIMSGWVLQPQTIMELRPLTLQQSLAVISWLLAQPMHVVEHLTSWWLMFQT